MWYVKRMKTLDDFRQFLAARIKDKKVSQTVLSQALDIEQGSLSRFAKGQTGISGESLFKLLRYFDLLRGPGVSEHPADIAQLISKVSALEAENEELKRQRDEFSAENKELVKQALEANKEARDAYKMMLEARKERSGHTSPEDEDKSLEAKEPMRAYPQPKNKGFLQEE